MQEHFVIKNAQHGKNNLPSALGLTEKSESLIETVETLIEESVSTSEVAEKLSAIVETPEEFAFAMMELGRLVHIRNCPLHQMGDMGIAIPIRRSSGHPLEALFGALGGSPRKEPRTLSELLEQMSGGAQRGPLSDFGYRGRAKHPLEDVFESIDSLEQLIDELEKKQARKKHPFAEAIESLGRMAKCEISVSDEGDVTVEAEDKELADAIKGILEKRVAVIKEKNGAQSTAEELNPTL